MSRQDASRTILHASRLVLYFFLVLFGATLGIYLATQQDFYLKREIDLMDLIKVAGGLFVLFVVQQALEKRRGAERYERDLVTERLKQCYIFLQTLGAIVDECRQEDRIEPEGWNTIVRTFRNLRMHFEATKGLLAECMHGQLAKEIAAVGTSIDDYYDLLTGAPPGPFPSEWRRYGATRYLRTLTAIDLLILRANRT